MTGKGRVVYQSIRIVYHLKYFHRSSMHLSKVITKKLLVTFHGLRWPRRHRERSLVAIFRFRVLSFSVTKRLRVFRFVPVKKRHRSIFSPWLLEKSKNWPDLRSQIWKFRDKYFIDAVTSYQSPKVSMRSLSRCGYNKHSNFFWGEVTWCNLMTWL